MQSHFLHLDNSLLINGDLPTLLTGANTLTVVADLSFHHSLCFCLYYHRGTSNTDKGKDGGAIDELAYWTTDQVTCPIGLKTSLCSALNYKRHPHEHSLHSLHKVFPKAVSHHVPRHKLMTHPDCKSLVGHYQSVEVHSSWVWKKMLAFQKEELTAHPLCNHP